MSRLTKTGETVAVKEVHCTKTSSNYIGSLTREMQLYTLVGDHPNVLKLIGVCLHLGKANAFYSRRSSQLKFA